MKDFLLVGAIVLGLISTIAFCCMGIYNDGVQRIKDVQAQGQRAFENGLPATANPHTAGFGELWLEAWLDAKEGAE